MENNATQPDTSSESGSQSKEHISAHELVNKKIGNEKFHVSEEQFKNIDTSSTVGASNQNEADQLAENLDKDGAGNSTELIGK